MLVVKSAWRKDRLESNIFRFSTKLSKQTKKKKIEDERITKREKGKLVVWLRVVGKTWLANCVFPDVQSSCSLKTSHILV